MCIVTRAEALEDALIRFACAPDGTVVPDLSAKLPGRGVWVTCSRKVLDEAIKRKAFTRGFEQDCTVPEGLADMVSGLLRKQAVNHLSLARKAGDAVQGFTKVDEAMRKGPVRVLLHMAGAGADGVAKLDRLKQPATVVTESLLSSEMDLAFGRENVVHAAVAAGGLAERLVVLLQRMQNFEGDGPLGPEGSKEKI
jgi:predicted RNA-binding protein YlxR (DUF448 family)